MEVKSQCQHREEEETVKMLGSRKSIPRRNHIKKDDVSDSNMESLWDAEGVEQPTEDWGQSTVTVAGPGLERKSLQRNPRAFKE